MSVRDREREGDREGREGLRLCMILLPMTSDDQKAEREKVGGSAEHR